MVVALPWPELVSRYPIVCCEPVVGTHLAWHPLALGLRDPKARGRADASAKQIEYPSRGWDTQYSVRYGQVSKSSIGL